MEFNYGVEKEKFDKRWLMLCKEYSKAGMSPDDIKAMYQYDLKEFRARRSYCKYHQLMGTYEIDGDLVGEDKSPLLNKFFDRFSVKERITDPSRRYGWVDELDSPEIAKFVKKLPEDSIELLTLYCMEGFSEDEIGVRLGVTQQAISKRLKKLRSLCQVLKRK